MNTKKICVLGIIVALSMIFSYIESMINILPAIPGFKIGFANIGVLFCLYKYSFKDAFLVLLLRVILVSILFTNGLSFIYSLVGACLSLLVMTGLRKTNNFSIYAISSAGGVCHNLGQLAVAALLLNTKAVISYIPFLIIFGFLAGLIMGMVSKIIINRINISEI